MKLHSKYRLIFYLTHLLLKQADQKIIDLNYSFPHSDIILFHPVRTGQLQDNVRSGCEIYNHLEYQAVLLVSHQDPDRSGNFSDPQRLISQTMI